MGQVTSMEVPREGKWKVGLPVFREPGAATDNSTRQEYKTCLRKGFYRYGMRRGFEGKSWPIQYGLGYHKYRETVELEMLQRDCKMSDEIHDLGWEAAILDWEDPPIGHPKEFLDRSRLWLACQKARERIEMEQKSGTIIVTRAEDSFDLEFPFTICQECGWATLEPVQDLEQPNQEFNCGRCDLHAAIRTRHGGRVDQFVRLSSGLYIRDFKTTGFRSKHSDKKFDRSSQVQGYVWAGSRLAGRRYNGAIIETVYNTKTRGPEITQQFVDYSKGQMEQWMLSEMMWEQFIQTCWNRIEELGYAAFPQNTNACTQMGLCGFADACSLDSGRQIDRWLKNNTIYSHWDFMNPDKEESRV